MNESYFESIFAIFDKNTPFVYSGHFLGTFQFDQFQWCPDCWIELSLIWIESAEFILKWMIFWIESWVKQYWIECWMNNFLAKFKHWIEPDRVSNTSIAWWRFAFCNVFNSRFKAVFFWKRQAPVGWQGFTFFSSAVCQSRFRTMRQCHNGVTACTVFSWFEPVWPKLACSWFQV